MPICSYLTTSRFKGSNASNTSGEHVASSLRGSMLRSPVAVAAALIAGGAVLYAVWRCVVSADNSLDSDADAELDFETHQQHAVRLLEVSVRASVCELEPRVAAVEGRWFELGGTAPTEADLQQRRIADELVTAVLLRIDGQPVSAASCSCEAEYEELRLRRKALVAEVQALAARLEACDLT